MQGPPTITYPSRLDRKPSWRAAAVFKPTSFGSIYFDYGTPSIRPPRPLSLTVGPKRTGTANLGPGINRSYELGTKWDLNNGHICVRADLFRTTKENAREASPTNSLVYVLAGTQRVDGAELVINGRVSDRWQVLSSYTFMHSEVVHSQYYPLSVGYRLANVPENLFNIWTTYEPMHRLMIGAASNYVEAARPARQCLWHPSTGLVNRSRLRRAQRHGPIYGHRHSVPSGQRFNLANRNYIDEIHPAHIVPGAGTSDFSASTSGSKQRFAQRHFRGGTPC